MTEQDTAVQENGLQTARSARSLGQSRLLDRYGGYSWGADFLGFAVAIFFTVVLFGIVGAIVGTVGYQIGAPVPKAGTPLAGTTVNLGIGGLIGGLIALFLAYLIGGYAAGRMARFDGLKQGVGVVVWTVIVGVALGLLGAIVGGSFNVGSQLHLHIDSTALTIGGLVSLALALAAMLLGAGLGGILGSRSHRAIDAEIIDTRTVHDYDSLDVVDSNSDDIGTVERSYVDADGAVRLVQVKIGTLAAKHRFIPVDEAVAVDHYLRVPYTREAVEQSPDARDAGDTLQPATLEEVRSYYNGPGGTAGQGSGAVPVEDRSDERVGGGQHTDVPGLIVERVRRVGNRVGEALHPDTTPANESQSEPVATRPVGASSDTAAGDESEPGSTTPDGNRNPM